MLKSRSFLLLVASPLVVALVLAGIIFGGQAMSDGNVDSDIQHALADELDTSGDIELSKLQKVQYGYTICGLYRTASSDSGYASFLYDKENDSVELDINSRRYKSRCSLSVACQ
ncbi:MULTISPECIES: hypothetical protein [unclassified Halomonas]|uniref:hypothetical protein n=1 Tax=unclassified Halomonas TaxID=2609666 RepID=UPI0006DABF14|nr:MULTISPECIES: hypothetical protein [unclassified Halomonas]KPQ31083.1 MAG: hypothetical protein HLUCCO06_15815 [Halomonas sp. HL-93]SBR47549.1 hypothetical protein GA0071314_1261 [Halomonas sp. HL-93]SNY99269.1 hypothetical protein SAMN04488142_3911 [Halomonas sp. hl-4]